MSGNTPNQLNNDNYLRNGSQNPDLQPKNFEGKQSHDNYYYLPKHQQNQTYMGFPPTSQHYLHSQPNFQLYPYSLPAQHEFSSYAKQQANIFSQNTPNSQLPNNLPSFVYPTINNHLVTSYLPQPVPVTQSAVNIGKPNSLSPGLNLKKMINKNLLAPRAPNFLTNLHKTEMFSPINTTEYQDYTKRTLPYNENISYTTSEKVDSNGSSSKPKAKRLKLSYTCTECRRRRIKCDRMTPCGACKSKNYDCKYDTKNQKQPKKPNKDAVIARLNKQLQFYRDLAFKHAPTDEFLFFSNELDNNVEDFEDNYDDLKNYSNNNFLLKFKNSSSEKDLNVFSDIYIFKNEPFVNLLFFSKKHSDTLPSKNPGFIEQQSGTRHIENHHSSVSLVGGDDDTNRSLFLKNLIFNSRFDSTFQKHQAESFVKRMVETNLKNSFKPCDSVFSGIFTTFEFDGIKENTIEDNSYTDVQSDLLTKILETINECLPSMERIVVLKKLYYSKIYTTLPCFDIDVFESYCETFLRPESNGTSKLKVVLRGKNLRNKMANVALLFLILKSSDMIYKSQLEKKPNMDGLKDNFKNDPGNKFDELDVTDFLKLAVRLLMTTNPLLEPSEHKLSAYCQLWVSLGFLPDSKFSSDLVAGKPTDYFASFILNMAFNCGILPVKNNNFDTCIKRKVSDTKTLNHWKKVSFFITQMKYAERLLKGTSYSSLTMKSHLNESDWESLILEYRGKSSYDNFIAELSLKRLTFFKLIDDCYSLCDGNFVNVNLFEKNLTLLNSFFTKNNDMVTWNIPDEKDVLEISKNNTGQINRGYVANNIIFENNCFYKVNLMKMSHVLILALESSLLREYNAANEKLLFKYHIFSFTEAVSCCLMLERYAAQKYVVYLGKTESLTRGKVVNLGYSRSMIILLQFLSKSFVYKIYLQKCIYNDENLTLKTKEELKMVTLILEKVSKFLFKTAKLYKKEYKFLYFQSFKMCIFFDFFKHTYENNFLYNYIFDTESTYKEDEALPEDVANNELLYTLMPLDSDYGKLFMEINKILSEDEVTEYLKDYENAEKETTTNSTHQSTEKVNTGGGNNTLFDNFYSDSYLKDFDLNDLNLFSNGFLP